MGHRTRSTLRACGATLALCAIGAAVAAGAGASNAAVAHLCQQGGWQQLVTSADEPFANEGACVRYGAQGGTPRARVMPDARCADGGHRDVFRQDGTAFASEAACHRYAASDALVHLAVTQTGEFATVKGRFVLTDEAGYGLLPGSGVVKCGIPPEQPDWCWPARTVAADGTHAASSGMYWDEESGGHQPEPGTFFCWVPQIIPSGHVTGIYLVGTTAAGAPVRSRTIVPTGCG